MRHRNLQNTKIYFLIRRTQVEKTELLLMGTHVIGANCQQILDECHQGPRTNVDEIMVTWDLF